VRAVDDFLEPYWNLEQIRAWAETRKPDAVRFASIPKYGVPQRGSVIELWCIHAATGSAQQDSRDIGAELWMASGWTPPSKVYVAPPQAQKLADQLGIPIFNKDVQVRSPAWPQRERLFALLPMASKAEGEAVVGLTTDFAEDKTAFASNARLNSLSPELRSTVLEFFSSPEPHGPPHVFIRGAFPTVQYLEYLFRTGTLSATANLPGEPKAYELSRGDWAGLEIACGGEFRRLGIWRAGKVRMDGEGDFENVRVEREAVLALFPAEPPQCPVRPQGKPSDDIVRELIRGELEKNEGYFSQECGAKIVREIYPKFPKKRAMALTKGLTGNETPGPRGPRKNLRR
jgi:hypothetical protein